MEATLTLNQAGQQLGVDDDALSRLITLGALPEARQIAGPNGMSWVIPQRLLPLIAARNGWTIDLRGDRTEISVSVPADATPAAVPLEPSADGQVPVSTEVQAMADLVASQSVTPIADSTESGESGDDLPEPAADQTLSISDVLDAAVLDRLLGIQEEKVVAEARAEEAKHALAALNQTHNRLTSELEIERHERLVTTDRYREERLARSAADAKVAELRNRVSREMSLADSERQARSQAMDRVAETERHLADAVASMGWLARRRYRRHAGATGPARPEAQSQTEM